MHLQSLKKQLEGYTKREIERADKARKFYHMVGAPNLDNLKMVIRQNLFKNCPITTQDVNLAEKIFGKDISTLKGRSTRPNPEKVIDDIIDIPEELIRKNNAIELAIDLIFINQVILMTTIDRTVKYRTVVPLDSRRKEELYRGLDTVLRLYNKAGFKIKMIHCDGEFKSIMDPVVDNMDIEMNYSAPDMHVPDIERNNRVIKERFRIAYYRLPYKKIPRIMIRYLAMVCARQLNLFPAKHGISKHYSPHMIITGRNFDYKKYCVCEFGAYVQGTTKTTNTNLARTIDAIYLRPANSINGGHEVMDLSTGKLNTCMQIKQVAITELAIKAVEKIAEDQGFKSLKFFNRKKENELFLDSDMVTGVDIPHNEDNEDSDSDSDSDSEEEERNETDNEDSNSDSDSDSEEEERNEEQIQEIISDMNDDHALINSKDNNDDDDKDHKDDGVNNKNDDDDEDHEDNEVNEKNIDNEHNEGDSDSDNEDSDGGRPTRKREVPVRLDPTWGAKSYAQAVKNSKKYTTKKPLKSPERTKTIRFQDEKLSHRSEVCHNLIHQGIKQDNKIEYDCKTGLYIARTMSEIRSQSMLKGYSYAQQYSLKKGLKKFGDAGKVAATKELDQLYKRDAYRPIKVKDLTSIEKRKAQEGLMLITEKDSGAIKARYVYNGKPTRDFISREEAASPTAHMESISITCAIDAHENRDTMVADVPNAFIQAKMPEAQKGERVIMKITGQLVDMMVELNPSVYGDYVVFEGKRKVIYVVVLRALYGMLVASLLWYKKFRKDLETIGFEFNPYDPCVANRIKNEKQHTVRFHVDDIMSSHVNKKVNDKFLEWLNRNYGKLKRVTSSRGDVHEFLGMTIDFTEKGKVKFRMDKYVERMLEEFPMKFKSTDTAMTPASNNLFEVGNSKPLGKDEAEAYHTFIAKNLFLCKRARPDIQPTIAVLATRVQKPNNNDWLKLVRLMKYLNGTKKFHLNLKIDNLKVIKWYVDAAFATHPDFRSHTGGVMTMGAGAIQATSMKQKLNTRSSTEAEIVGVDDMASKIFWTKLFIEAQGYKIEKNIIYQDNKSSILLEQNGKRSSGKKTRAMNIRYFFITDQVKKGNATIVHCPTGAMIGDFMTKALQGTKFREFRKAILGM